MYVHIWVWRHRRTSRLNLPVFPTTNLLYASLNKLAEVALRYSIPLQGRKLNLEQNIFDQVDI